MFKYNRDGYLRPYNAIDTTLQAFKAEFLWNDHRTRLFKEFEKYLQLIKELQPGAFYIWIDGSFTSKKELPGDLDFVVFLNFVFIKETKSKLDYYVKQFARYFDVSYAVEYPVNHKFRNVTEILRNQYHDLYGTTRRTPEKPSGRPKGYIQIKFDYEKQYE